MLASLADAPLDDPQLIYEPKYDGIRAIAEVSPGGPVRLWSRRGNEKTSQFPEIAEALATWGQRLKAPVVLDGEIVALDAAGQPTGFQQLQYRIHKKYRVHVRRPELQLGRDRESPASVAFIAFDALREGRADLCGRPLLERRATLERLFARIESPMLRISEMVRGDGRALYRRALDRGWEGLIVKRADSRYRPGTRTPDWRKLKIVYAQELVVGGWTEPRQTRAHFGALLLGVYERNRLVYVGHTGTGFNERELARVMSLLRPLETKACPFAEPPPTNERPHWVKPRLVAEIKFAEWTADAKLRHPVYLGLRDDKDPRQVRREQTSRLHATASARAQGSGFRVQGSEPRTKSSAPSTRDQEPGTRNLEPGTRNREPGTRNREPGTRNLVDQLRAIEDSRRDGTLDLPDGGRLTVTNLHKVFWPRQKLTKGDLFRYYAQVARFILPALADRPLVMKRFPNGITGKPFYQHRVENVPQGVRVEAVEHMGHGRPFGRAQRRPERVEGRVGMTAREQTSQAETRPQLVGGDLQTLLYMTQLAAISEDPWFSRVQSLEFADHAALDLDPMPGIAFGRVLEVARWIRDELESLGIVGFPKTSGSDGLHIYVPLPPQTPYEAGLIFCQIVATVVAHKHPKQATIERGVGRRGNRVYIDCLQNIPGKTLATAYSARASDYAGVSTPLRWDEVDAGVDREDFTIRSVPARLHEVGDLWAPLRRSKGVDLSRVSLYAERTGKEWVKRAKS